MNKFESNWEGYEDMPVMRLVEREIERNRVARNDYLIFAGVTFVLAVLLGYFFDGGAAALGVVTIMCVGAAAHAESLRRRLSRARRES